MSRGFFKSEQLLALLLPLTLFSIWEACLVSCGENAAHHDDFDLSAVIESAGDCFDLRVAPENCPTNALAAVLQERQTIRETAISAGSSPTAQSRVVAPAAGNVRLPEINQKSPPGISSARLFMRFCAFRI